MDCATKSKYCKGCQQIKPLTDYYRAGTSWQSRCKPCHAINGAINRKKRPKKPSKPPKQRINNFQKLSPEIQQSIIKHLDAMSYSKNARMHGINVYTFLSWRKRGIIREYD